MKEDTFAQILDTAPIQEAPVKIPSANLSQRVDALLPVLSVLRPTVGEECGFVEVQVEAKSWLNAQALQRLQK